jgi:nitrogen fixation/metabolism regulation signal transduction histidine kinase
VDDLTELLHAQKTAAWQEVAQRIAHEIKNPLTPIQLSAQRLTRYLERRHPVTTGSATEEPELPRLVRECAELIEREVATLASLVDEFSQFVRFPKARLASTEPNAIVTSALEVFAGRLDGIAIRTSLGSGLPAIRADAELLRRVLVNLIDNAAEAMEGSAAKELRLATRLNAPGEAVEIVVADTGHGISPQDKDKLFLPHFSTKDRGTGLGLAIAARIVSEHHGTIRVEDNAPIGSRFVIQLPVAEVPATPLAAEQ